MSVSNFSLDINKFKGNCLTDSSLYFIYKKFYERIIEMSKQEYFMLLKEEIIKQGGSLTDLLFITDEMIENAMKNEREPKDLAWAVLQ